MVNKKYNDYKNPFRNGRVFCCCVFLIGTMYTICAQPQLKFKNKKQNFGFVKKGEVVKITFIFYNVGNEPLTIYDAAAECTCTTVVKPEYSVLPNMCDSITILFDTKSVYDRQDRFIEIRSNSTKKIQNIRFKGVVLQ